MNPKKNARTLIPEMLRSEETYATTIYFWFMDTFGSAGIDWHPETIEMEIEGKTGVKLPKIVFDRLMAAIKLTTDDSFFNEVPAFIAIANILSGDDFSPEEFDPADSFECAWGATEALILRPPESDDDIFSPEVCTYIGAALKEEGYITPPDILRIAVGADFANQVSSDFSSDPVLFAGIYQNQQSKTADLESMLRDNLLALANQLEVLPLNNPKIEEITREISTKLRKAAEAKQTQESS